jgi:hypothetical protein
MHCRNKLYQCRKKFLKNSIAILLNEIEWYVCSLLSRSNIAPEIEYEKTDKSR